MESGTTPSLQELGRTFNLFLHARYLAAYTIGSVLAEIQRRLEVGRSCLAELLAKLKIAPARASTLTRVY